MKKKKAIKIAAATAMAASSFTAVAPFSTEAAVNVSASVTTATTQMQKAYNTYYNAALKGQAVSAATVQAQVTLAQKYYATAQTNVKKYAGSKKSYYTSKLNAALPYLKNAQYYINGEKYAEGVKAQSVALETAVSKGETSTVASAFNAYSTKLAGAEQKVRDLVAGKNAENAVINANIKTPKANLPLIKAYVYASKAIYWINNGDQTTAQARLDVANSEFKNGNATSNLGQAVSKYIKSIQDQFTAQFTAIKAVSPVANITVTEGENVTLPTTVTVTTANGATKDVAVTWDSASLDTKTAGSYTLVGTVEGTNIPAKVTVTVKAAADATAPVITLNGNANISLNYGQSYTEAGATATDNKDAHVTVTSAITDAAGNSVAAIDGTVAGTYTVTYTAVDAAGNQATPVTRTVVVGEAADAQAPVITLNGDANVSLAYGTAYTEAGATVTDNKDTNLQATATITDAAGNPVTAIDGTVAGTYTVTYTAADAAGNQATPVKRTVVVGEAADTQAPVITLNGDANVSVAYGTAYTEAGATVADNKDTNLQATATIADAAGNPVTAIDGTVPGTYTVTYTAVDAAGNQATPVKRTVVVGEAPVAATAISAASETTVQATVPATVKEADLTGKQVTLKSGQDTLTATYVAASLTDKSIATFKLDNDAKLVDAKTYSASSNWASFTPADFVAKVATPYVASFEKSTTGITAGTTTTINIAAKNQYGEDIAAPATVNQLKVTLNGMPLSASEATYANGVVTINKSLAESDNVSINLVTTKTVNGNTVDVANSTLAYTVLKADTSKISSITLNAGKVSLPAKDSTDLTVKVLDQFNNPITDPATGFVDPSTLRFVVNGNIVTPNTTSDPVQYDIATGKYTFKTSTPGTYKVDVYSTSDSKVSASTTITVGAATLTGLVVNSTKTAAYNNEAVDLGTVKPNDGAALTADNLKFNVTSTTPGVTADDVKVTASTDKDGNIVVSATADKSGVYTITPYVGDSFTATNVIKNGSFALTTSVNPTVASISDVTFDAKELKVGASVKKEIVFKNKYGEVLTAAQANASVTSSASSVIGDGAIVQGSQATNDADKTYLEFTPAKAGTTQLTVQAGNVLKSYTVPVVDSVVTTIDAGADVSGVVAGDDSSLAKYNNVAFLDQDGVALTNQTLTAADVSISVQKPDGSNLANASDLVTVNGTDVKDKDGNTVNAAGQSIKVLPIDTVAAGTYKVTVSKVVSSTQTVSDSFNVTVGAARTLTTVDVASSVSELTVDGTTKVLVTPKDQYGNVVPGATVSLTPNTTVTASAFTPKTDNDGKLLGYEATLTGVAKGTVNAEFVATTGSGTTAVTQKATKSYTVDAVGNLAASVDVTNPGLLYSGNQDLTGTGLQLVATVKDANGNVVNTASGDLTWTAKNVVITKADGTTGTASDATVNLTADGVLKVTGVDAAVKSISFDAEAQTANLKVGSTKVEISTEAPKLVGDLAVVPTVADKVLDADSANAGIQIALDGDAKDGEATDGTIAVQLEGNDQYGNKNVDFYESQSFVSTNDKTIATISQPKPDVNGNPTNGAIVITPVSVGTTQVHIQYAGQTVNLDVTVTPNNTVIKEKTVLKAANDALGGKVTASTDGQTLTYAGTATDLVKAKFDIATIFGALLNNGVVPTSVTIGSTTITSDELSSAAAVQAAATKIQDAVVGLAANASHDTYDKVTVGDLSGKSITVTVGNTDYTLTVSAQ